MDEQDVIFDHELITVADDEVINAADHEVVTAAEHEVVNVGNHEMFDVADNKVVNVGDHEMFDVADNKVVHVGDHEMFDVADNKVVHVGDHEMFDVADDDVIYVGDHKVIDVADREAINVADHEAISVADEEPPEPQYPVERNNSSVQLQLPEEKEEPNILEKVCEEYAANRCYHESSNGDIEAEEYLIDMTRATIEANRNLSRLQLPSKDFAVEALSSLQKFYDYVLSHPKTLADGSPNPQYVELFNICFHLFVVVYIYLFDKDYYDAACDLFQVFSLKFTSLTEQLQLIIEMGDSLCRKSYGPMIENLKTTPPQICLSHATMDLAVNFLVKADLQPLLQVMNAGIDFRIVDADPMAINKVRRLPTTTMMMESDDIEMEDPNIATIAIAESTVPIETTASTVRIETTASSVPIETTASTVPIETPATTVLIKIPTSIAPIKTTASMVPTLTTTITPVVDEPELDTSVIENNQKEDNEEKEGENETNIDYLSSTTTTPSKPDTDTETSEVDNKQKRKKIILPESSEDELDIIEIENNSKNNKMAFKTVIVGSEDELDTSEVDNKQAKKKRKKINKLTITLDDSDSDSDDDYDYDYDDDDDDEYEQGTWQLTKYTNSSDKAEGEDVNKTNSNKNSCSSTAQGNDILTTTIEPVILRPPSMDTFERNFKQLKHNVASELLTADAESSQVRVCTYHFNLSTICSVGMSRDLTKVAVGTENSAIMLWDFELVNELEYYSARALKQWKRLPVKRLISEVNFDAPVYKSLREHALRDADDDVFDVRRAPEVKPNLEPTHLLGHSSAVYDLNFLSNDILLSASGDRSLRAWDINAGTCVATYRGHSSPIWSVDVMPDQQHQQDHRPQQAMFVSGASDGSAHLWDAERSVPLRVYHGHDADINQVRFHPNGNYFATASSDRMIVLWDVNQNRQVRQFMQHISQVNSIAFSPCGRFLYSGGDDCTLLMWDLADGRCLASEAHPDIVRSVGVSPGGARIALLGCHSGEVNIWRRDQLLAATDYQGGGVKRFTLGKIEHQVASPQTAKLGEWCDEQGNVHQPATPPAAIGQRFLHEDMLVAFTKDQD